MTSATSARVETGRFVREFARDPLHTASVTPSPQALAAAMALPLPVTGTPVVVELGPGPGAFTRTIQECTGGRARHVAVELNARWARPLADRGVPRHPRR